MELDDLKSLWKKQDDSFRPRNEMELVSMLNGRSKSIIAKLKRNVWIELVFTLIAGVGLLIYALTLESSALKNISIAVLIVFVGYTVYYIKKLILLTRFNSTGNNVRANLENLVENLSGYLKYYKLSYTILYPAYFILGVIFGGLERGGPERLFEVLSETRTIIILLVFCLLFYFSSTWLVNWLLKKLYGNHLEKLKGLLSDIHGEPKMS
jgi:ABC-type multidrug transport system fused ATPase/permease subunit